MTTLHLPENTVFAPDSALLEREILTLTENDWQQMAVQNHIGLKESQTAVLVNEQKVKLERSERLPKISLMAAEHLDGPITIEVPVLDNNFNYWYVGVGVKYSLSSLLRIVVN